MEGCGKVWRGVEGCGGVWRGVEECGGVWSGVEGCGGVWRSVKGCGKVCKSRMIWRRMGAKDNLRMNLDVGDKTFGICFRCI